MKSIIEREVTLKNNSDMEVKVTKTIITSICKGNEARHAQPSNRLDKPSTEGEPPLEVSVHA